MRFYLGTHMRQWLWSPRFASIPLFVSRRRLALRPPRRYQRALAPYALDSGGFTELSLFGRWTLSARDYIAEVRRYAEQLGAPEWVAPQDWMCEPFITERTGLSVAEHQRRTVDNLVELRTLAPELRFAPVLQGFAEREYVACAELYDRAGIDLRAEPLVGLGTICRRQGTQEAQGIVERFAAEGLRLHAFGAKVTGLRRYADRLSSSDSLAWSFNARKHPPLPGCRHRSCANCDRWALRWRERLLDGLPVDGDRQLDLFGGGVMPKQTPARTREIALLRGDYTRDAELVVEQLEREKPAADEEWFISTGTLRALLARRPA